MVFGSMVPDIQSTTVPKDIERIIRNVSYYDRHASPEHGEAYATEVNISMYIEGISSFNAQTMDFHVDIYFQESWYDHRLRHNHSKRVLIRDENLFEMMWHPDIYFANARESKFHTVTAPNFLVWIHQDGRVYYDCRISLTVMCMMDLTRYPLDGQECELRILSYAYDEEQLKLQWIEGDDAITKNDGIKLPNMNLMNIRTGSCNGTFPTGTWSCVTAEFIVQREIMHHVLQSYVPTALIVTISWFSFWLDVDSVPGRVSLCITTLLTLATQASAARLALPQVSYIKAIDVWMGTCLAFVFGVMIEFTLVNYWSRRKPARDRHSGGHQRVTAKEMLRKWSELARYESSRGDDQPVVVDPLKMPTLRHRNGGSAMTDGMGGLKATTTRLDTRCEQSQSEWKTLLFPAESPVNRDTDNYAERHRFLVRTQNRKAAQMIDRFCRVLFPFSFFVFNCAYWVYYLYWTQRNQM